MSLTPGRRNARMVRALNRRRRPLRRLSRAIGDSGSGCLIWTGPRDRGGYGTMRHRGRTVGAHRVAWTEAYGDIPADKWVLHRCVGRPACIEPTHLYLGTAKDNAADMIAAGTMPRGERNGRAKLRASDVARARAEHADGASIRSLAREVGVAQQTLNKAITRVTWAHV